MALNVVNEYLQLVEKKSIPFNWRWKIRESSFNSLYELRHSHEELEHLLIDYFNANLNPTNSTHITVDDIDTEFVDDIATNVKKTENKLMEAKQNFIKIQTNIEQEKKEEPKRKSMSIWIFISVIVTLIIMGFFMKIGCFSKCTAI